MYLNKNVIFAATLSPFMAESVMSETTVEQGMVVTYQTADDDVSKDELIGSYDLVADTTIGKSGHMIMYVEGASSQAGDSVSSTFGEANGDAGSVTNYDSNGGTHGGFQVSELFYQHDIGDNFVTIGMMDATAYGDGGEIANDEGASFITTDLVNNTTIQFPNYTMGVGAHAQFGSIGINLFYGGAEGFNGDYSELLHWQSNKAINDKGEFILVEGSWETDSTVLRLGYWSNNDFNNAKHDGSEASNASNSGAYGLAEIKFGSLTLNGRFGVADDTVSEIDSFVSLAGELSVGPGALGLGYALSTVSGEVTKNDTSKDDRTSIEAFYRFEGGENWTVTPAISSIDNSGLSNATTASATVYTVRGTYSF